MLIRLMAALGVVLTVPACVAVTVMIRVATEGGVAMAGNVILGGIIGAGVDAGTGAMLDLTPNPAHVELRPQD